MDIARMSLTLNHWQLQQQVSISVMNKAMDQVEGNADFLSKMMEESNLQVLQSTTQPHLGGNINLKG